jgi:tetratricopeptide (TPR) repeat protein
MSYARRFVFLREVIRNCAMVSACICFAVTGHSAADVKAWKDALRAGEEAIRNKNYAEAESHYRTALREANAFDPKDLRVVETLFVLAQLYDDLEKFDRAEPLFRKAVELRGEAAGTNDLIFATLHTSLGISLAEQSRFRDAEQHFLVSKDIHERKLGAFHRAVGLDLHNLGTMYLNQNKLALAEPALKKALDILESASYRTGFGDDGLADTWVRPPKPERLIKTYESLAGLYIEQGKLKEAQASLKKSVQFAEHTFGKKSIQAAAQRVSMAECLRRQGQNAEAEKLLESSLAVFEKQFGPEVPLWGDTVVALAGLYLDQKQTGKADALLAKALARFESPAARNSDVRVKLVEARVALAKNQKNTAGEIAALDDLIELLVARQDYTRIPKLYERITTMPDYTQHARKLPGALRSLGEQYERIVSFGEAELWYQRSLELAEKTFGPNGLPVAATLHNLGRYREKQKKLDEAAAFYQRELQVLENAYGRDDGRLWNVLFEYSALLGRLNRNAEAEAAAKRAQAIREKSK